MNNITTDHSVYVITYDISTHRVNWENQQKFYDFIDDQDFCAITESSCLIASTLSTKELFRALTKFLSTDRDSFFIVRILDECEVSLPMDNNDRVRKWLKEHSM